MKNSGNLFKLWILLNEGKAAAIKVIFLMLCFGAFIIWTDKINCGFPNREEVVKKFGEHAEVESYSYEGIYSDPGLAGGGVTLIGCQVKFHYKAEGRIWTNTNFIKNSRENARLIEFIKSNKKGLIVKYKNYDPKNSMISLPEKINPTKN